MQIFLLSAEFAARYPIAYQVAATAILLTLAWLFYLLLRRRTAHLLTLVTVPYLLLMAVLVVLSPVNVEALESYKPSGAVLGWQWVRAMTPLLTI